MNLKRIWCRHHNYVTHNKYKIKEVEGAWSGSGVRVYTEKECKNCNHRWLDYQHYDYQAICYPEYYWDECWWEIWFPALDIATQAEFEEEIDFMAHDYVRALMNNDELTVDVCHVESKWVAQNVRSLL